MLRVADRLMDQEEEDVLLHAPESPMPRPASIQMANIAPPSRYGQSKSPNWVIIALILAVHAVLITAIMHVRHQVQRREELRLSVVNLTPPAPPPPQDAPPPPPSKPQIVAPAPVVRLATRSPQIATTPIAQPVAVSAPTVIAPAPTVALAAPSPPSTVQGGDLSTQMVSGKPPRYPIESRRKHEQGTVVLALTLGTDGAVEAIAVTRSSGFARLDDAARDAVRKWRWRPLVQQGRAVKVKGVVEIPFVLRSTSA